MILTYIVLILGFILLIKGADFFVDGSSSIAKLLRVPSAIIGLTIVAFGTSAPELSVSFSAAMQGQNEIAISNVLGSNIFNLMVVTGACAAVATIPVNAGILKREFPFSIFAAGLLLVFSLFGSDNLEIARMEGMTLLLLFILYIVMQVRGALKSRSESEEDPMENILSPFRSIALVIIGCIMIIFGGDFVVDSASAIAASFGLSETLIGLTIVAFGTSLPELVTSVVASRKGENDLAIGNVVGSNLFNILMILGISTSINPVPLNLTAVYDCILLILFSCLVLFFCWSKKKLGRGEGITMLILYAVYTIYIIMR
ncbi:MAG: calcium/sodium antiporter [Coprococcus sp.]